MATSRTGTTSHLRFRKTVLGRDRRAGVTNCPICQCTLDYQTSRTPQSAEPDHIIPAAVAQDLGWTAAQLNHPDNGRTICRRCNQSIGAKGDPKRVKPSITASPGW